MSTPKMADVVYAQNFLGRNRTTTDFARMTNAHGVSAKIGWHGPCSEFF
jgi:hypothetical protein